VYVLEEEDDEFGALTYQGGFQRHFLEVGKGFPLLE
jgi:hypothetical protein